MIEEINGETYEYDFYGFENFQAAEEMKKGLTGKIIGIGNSMTPILKSLSRFWLARWRPMMN